MANMWALEIRVGGFLNCHEGTSLLVHNDLAY